MVCVDAGDRKRVQMRKSKYRKEEKERPPVESPGPPSGPP